MESQRITDIRDLAATIEDIVDFTGAYDRVVDALYHGWVSGLIDDMEYLDSVTEWEIHKRGINAYELAKTYQRMLPDFVVHSILIAMDKA